MIFKHRAQTSTPNVSIIAGKYGEIAAIMQELTTIIQETNRNVYDDLKALETFEVCTALTLPTASEEWLGKPCIYISGTTPYVKICTITGVSPTAYGWRNFILGDVWNDINRSFSSAKVPAVNNPTWSTFMGNTKEYTFDINDYVDIEPLELLHGYRNGSDFEIHMHWATNGSEVGDTAVKWEIEYTIANMGNPLTTGVGSTFPATTVVSMEQTIPGDTADRAHMYVDLTEISGTGMTIGAIIKMRVRRIAAAGTDPAADPFGLMVGIHHIADTLGSTTEYAKL